MLRTLSRPLVAGVERYLPGAFVFAVARTVIVAVLALLFGGLGPVELTRAWGDGLGGLLAFMTQAALVLLLGYTLATARPWPRRWSASGASPGRRVRRTPSSHSSRPSRR